MDQIRQIVKRDGRTVDFNVDKIADAIYRAATGPRGKRSRYGQYLARQVEVYLLEICHNDIPTVEQIQDAVEKVLIENGHARTAKGVYPLQGGTYESQGHEHQTHEDI